MTDVKIDQFHQPVRGMEQEWHVYCERHPEWGFCGTESQAANAALDHGSYVHE